MPDFGDHNPNEEGRYQYQGTYTPYDYHMTPAEAAAYAAKRKRDAIIGSILSVGGMLGAQPFANMIGIGASGAGAAGSAMPAGYVPGWEGNANVLGFGSGFAPSGAAGGGGTVGAITGGAKAGGGLGGALAGLSAKDWMGLGLAGAGAVGGAMADQPNFAPNTMTSDPNLLKLMQTMQGRLDKSEPLYDSIMAMANGLLPTQYQKGGGGMP